MCVPYFKITKTVMLKILAFCQLSLTKTEFLAPFCNKEQVAAHLDSVFQLRLS